MRALILVADAGRARLFASAGRKSAWTLLNDLEHRAVTAERGRLASDRPGRTQERMAGGRRASLEAPTPPKRVEAEKFAAELARTVEAAAAAADYDRLVVVAPPRFLGSLRRAIAAGLANKLDVFDINKDLSAVPDVELPAHITAELRERALPVV